MKSLYKSIGVVILFTMVFGLALAGINVFPVNSVTEASTTPSPLHVSGNRLINASGQTVWLKGVNTPSLEWSKSGENISQANYSYISSTWKANVVRVPINQDWALGDSTYLSKLDQIVGYTKNAGLYMIVDLHWISGKQQPMPNNNSITMWTKLASRWKGESHILYDVYNEPFDVTWSQWKPWAEKLIDAVRAGDSDAVCIVGGPDWSYDLSGFGANPVNRSNIMLSVHDYPWKVFPREQAYGYLANRYPILVGEWGAEDAKSGWANTLRDYINSKHLNYTAWAFYPGGDGFPSLIKSWLYEPTTAGEIVKNDLAGNSSAPVPTNAVSIVSNSISKSGNTVKVTTTLSSTGKKVYVRWKFISLDNNQVIAKVTSPLTQINGTNALSASKTLPNGRYVVRVAVLSESGAAIITKMLSGKTFSLPSN